MFLLYLPCIGNINELVQKVLVSYDSYGLQPFLVLEKKSELYIFLYLEKYMKLILVIVLFLVFCLSSSELLSFFAYTFPPQF